MSQSNVLIVGCEGVGVEIGSGAQPWRTWARRHSKHSPAERLPPARHPRTPTAKNVALAGVKSLTVHDDAPVVLADLTTQVRYRLSPPQRAPVCRRPEPATHVGQPSWAGRPPLPPSSTTSPPPTLAVRARRRAWATSRSSTPTCRCASSRARSRRRSCVPLPWSCARKRCCRSSCASTTCAAPPASTSSPPTAAASLRTHMAPLRRPSSCGGSPDTSVWGGAAHIGRALSCAPLSPCPPPWLALGACATSQVHLQRLWQRVCGAGRQRRAACHVPHCRRDTRTSAITSTARKRLPSPLTHRWAGAWKGGRAGGGGVGSARLLDRTRTAL